MKPNPVKFFLWIILFFIGLLFSGHTKAAGIPMTAPVYNIPAPTDESPGIEYQDKVQLPLLNPAMHKNDQAISQWLKSPIIYTIK